MLNIGCGARFHADWVNVDLAASAPGVRAMNILKGLDFPDASFEIVYHSHLLEHLPPEAAPAFLRECARVLAPNGVLRVAVPDLEQIAREYLRALHDADTCAAGAPDRLSWMTMELIDQMTRNWYGGRLALFAQKASPDLRRFALERWGLEARRLWGETGKSAQRRDAEPHIHFCKKIRTAVKNRLAKLLLGRDYPAYQSCLYRQSGEIHQWMYDRVSLKGLLEEAGFSEISVASAASSRIPGWAEFKLDTDENGAACKPDSLFMEGTKRAR